MYSDPIQETRFFLCRHGDGTEMLKSTNGPVLQIVLIFLVLLPVSCGDSAPTLQEDAVLPNRSPPPELALLFSKSDIVVLGWIDACWVCQFNPSPELTYSKILAGKVTDDRENEAFYLTSIPKRFLPQGGVPIYRSKKEEICFLKRVIDDRLKGEILYEVVEIWEATTDNLSLFY